MECLLCHFRSDVLKLKEYYQDYHLIDPKDEKILNLFKPDYFEDDKCIECSIVFSNSRKKKNHMFLKHYKQQISGSKNNVNAPLSILRRDIITYYSVNFDQHKSFYNFYSSDMIKDFFNNVNHTFKPSKNIKYKFQVYFELVNQQRTSDNQIFLTNNRSFLTNVFRFNYSNEFVRAELKNEITKRIIQNGLTGSSWYFRRFDIVNVIVVPLTKESKFITS